MEYGIVQRITSKTVERPSKKVEAIIQFLSEEFTSSGLNMPVSAIQKRFGKWNDRQKTVVASSLDLHKNILVACFIAGKRMFDTLSGRGIDLSTAYIPCFKVDGHGIPTVCTRRASEFENVYYETLDALREESERKAAKAESGDIDGLESVASGSGDITSHIADFIRNHAGAIDFARLQTVIDGLGLREARASA